MNIIVPPTQAAITASTIGWENPAEITTIPITTSPHTSPAYSLLSETSGTYFAGLSLRALVPTGCRHGEPDGIAHPRSGVARPRRTCHGPEAPGAARNEADSARCDRPPRRSCHYARRHRAPSGRLPTDRRRALAGAADPAALR